MSQVCVWRDWVLDRVSAIYTYEGWWDFAVRQFLVESRALYWMCVETMGGIWGSISEIDHSCHLHRRLLPLTKLISWLCRERRKMNVSTEGKSVGITKRGNAEVRTTNFSRFRDKRHLHWLLAILRLTKFCWSTTLLDAFWFVYLQLRLEPSSTGKAMFVM